MEIKELESVLAVSLYKSYSEAAYQLERSPATISKHVKHIEEELGVKLFDRTTTTASVSLTPEGAAILPYIYKMMETRNQMQDHIWRQKSQDNQGLAIGCIPLIGTIGEQGIMSSFAAEHPDTPLIQVVRTSSELTRLLRAGQLDGIFLMLIGSYEENLDTWNLFINDSLEIYPLIEKDVVHIGISEKHPLASRGSLCLEQLEGETFFFNRWHREEKYVQKQNTDLIHFLQSSGGGYHIKYLDFIGREVVLSLVAKGAGVLPQACQPPEGEPGIRFLRLDDWKPNCTGVFICRKSNGKAILKSFTEYVQKCTAP